MTNFFIGLGVLLTLFYVANQQWFSDEDTAQPVDASHEAPPSPVKLPWLPGAPPHDSRDWHERHLCLTPDCLQYRREIRKCQGIDNCVVHAAICSNGQCISEAAVQRDPAYHQTLVHIQHKVSQHWRIDADSAEAYGALVEVSLTPHGELLGVIFKERSGRDGFDFSVIDAIEQAAPFTEIASSPSAVRGLLQRFTMTFGSLPLSPQDIHSSDAPAWLGQQ